MFQGLRYDVGMCPNISMVRNPSRFCVSPVGYFSCVLLQRYGLQESPRWATEYSVMYVD